MDKTGALLSKETKQLLNKEYLKSRMETSIKFKKLTFHDYGSHKTYLLMPSILREEVELDE